MTCELYHVTRAHKVGDLVMFVVKILLYTPGIALVFSTMTIVAWKVFGDAPHLAAVAETVFYIALVPSFVVAVLIACSSLQWGMELDESGVRIVRGCGSTTVSYHDVTFVRLGTVSDQMARTDRPQPKDQRVQIEYHPHGWFAVWLPLAEAEHLFKSLQQRCDHAAGIDSQGMESAPRKDRECGVRLLTRKRLLSGSVLVAAGVFTLLLAVLGMNAEGGDSLDNFRVEAIRWLIIIQAPLIIIAGLNILRRRPEAKQTDRAKDRVKKNR